MHIPPQSAVSLPVTPFPRQVLAMARVLVIGDVMLDRYWFGDASRLSPEAPVPVVQITSCEDRLGGAANVARNIAALGAQVSLVGVVGDDDAGRCIGHLLQQAGIADCTCMRATAQTIVKLRVLGRRQQLLRIDFDGERGSAAAKLDAASLEHLVCAHDVIVLSDYAKGCLDDPQTVIRLAAGHGRPVLVDPKGEDFSGYAQAALLTPNLAELRLIVGAWRSESELADKAQSLRRSLSIPSLLLTRSADGMTLFDDDGAHHFPAQAREVFDVSGAGDTVIAVLASLLASGMRQDMAIALANRAAGLAVSKLGTATVSYDELFADSDSDYLPH